MSSQLTLSCQVTVSWQITMPYQATLPCQVTQSHEQSCHWSQLASHMLQEHPTSCSAEFPDKLLFVWFSPGVDSWCSYSLCPFCPLLFIWQYSLRYQQLVQVLLMNIQILVLASGSPYNCPQYPYALTQVPMPQISIQREEVDKHHQTSAVRWQ